jgi:alpha-N-arabinofuranosidase
MYRSLFAALALVACVASTRLVSAQTTYHVSVSGSDNNDGSSAHPFKTISRAAELAQPGDVVTVHAGIYREHVTPPRSGISDTKRIVYQAAPGEVAEIRGSDAVTRLPAGYVRREKYRAQCDWWSHPR